MAGRSVFRRIRVRQLRTGQAVPAWRRLYDRFGVTAWLIGATFFVATSLIALSGGYGSGYRVGQKIAQPIYAEVDYQVVDEQRTLTEKASARASAPSHYRVDFELITRIATEIQHLYQAAQEATDYAAFRQAAETNRWAVDETGYAELRTFAEAASNNRFESAVSRLRGLLVSEHTWDPASARERTPAPTAEHIVVHADDPASGESSEPRQISVYDLIPISNVTSLQRGAADLTSQLHLPDAVRATLNDLLVRGMASSPVLRFDAARTNEEMSRAEQNVSEVTVSYAAGQPLIPLRTDRGLTAADVDLLARHEAAHRAFLASDDARSRGLRERDWLRRGGTAGVLLLVSVLMFTYVGLYQPRILEMPWRCLGLAALLVGALLAGRVVVARVGTTELAFGPVWYVAAILAIAYTRRFAVSVATFLAVLLTLSVRGDFAMMVTMLLGAAATVVGLKQIRTRERLFWVGVTTAAVACVTTTSFRLMDGQALGFALTRGAWSSATGAVTIMMVLTTLPLIERMFRMATPLTLLEWRDPTKPLLQRLAREAPGTYSHSLALGTLAGAACDAIGANGLLAQVGALYHDIGKLQKVEYFAENQEARINRHRNLSPTMSLLIIIGHVKDGVEMAKEYKLPRVLHQFIDEHHGTTVVRYFHHLAEEQQPAAGRGRPDRDSLESQFRYPGPKPRTKESAVLMLCDGVEGAVRTLDDPSAGRIEQLIHGVVSDRLHDGQLEDCDITLRELHRVEESLVKSVCGQYHGRVPYPKGRERPERPSDRPVELEGRVAAR